MQPSQLKRYIAKIHKLNELIYNIGFVEKDVIVVADCDLSSDKVNWLDLNGYSAGWFADPFILTVDADTVKVLAEEMYQGLGRIVLLTVSRKGYKLIKVKELLRLETHLSFPAYIYDEEGNLYIYPENYQGGCLKLYPFDLSTETLGAPMIIIDKPMIDTQIIRIDDAYYAFGVTLGEDARCDNRVLHIFKSTSLTGEYKEIQTIENPMKQERGAGMIFKLGEKLLRPSQICENKYGEATIINELNFNNGHFEERPILTIRPDGRSRWGNLLHTFNLDQRLVVIDGLGYRYPVAHSILSPFIKLLHAIE